MCGIAGKLYFDPSKVVEKSILKEMTDSIIHRGPDDEGHLIIDNIGMGFRRLSIIDLNLGQQPLSNYGKTLWITFNGEIYNYKELRKDLEKKKYKFRTNSDTEVIVNLYEEYGYNCLKYLRGMFAFVIWDDKNKKLFGARDRVGIKPFYYYHNSDQFIWGSEIKAIKAGNNLITQIDNKSLDQYLNYGHTLRSSSIYNNIKKLLPGHYFFIEPLKSKEIKIKKYWDIKINQDSSKSFKEYREELLYELKESVKMRMISDVPLGAFLSGGVDSSSVVSLMCELSSKPIKTFSIGFKEEKFNELKYAKILSNKYKTEHHEFIIEPDSIDNLSKIVNMFGEPLADSSIIPTYFLSKYTKEHVTVSLSGDGGDELFAGYSSYNNMQKLNNRPLNFEFFNKAISKFNSLVPDYIELKKWLYYFSINSNNIGAYLGIFKEYERCNLYNFKQKNILNEYISENDKVKLLSGIDAEFISKMQILDIKTYLVDDILTKVDIASMSNSLEVRVPILDHKLIELALNIPSEMKINNKNQKIIFKDAVKSLLPPQIISHKKQGFNMPISSWFRGSLNDYTKDILLSKNAKIYSYLNRNYIKDIIDNHNLGFRNYSAKIWSLLVLEEWLKENN